MTDNPEYIHAVRRDCIVGYEWPSYPEVDIRALDDLSSVVVEADLDRIVTTSKTSGSLTLTLLSSEYLGLLDLWVSHCIRHQLNFAVVACDDGAESELRRRGIHSLRAYLQIPGTEAEAGFLSRQGFTAKGLAVIGLKYPLVRRFVSAGLDVTLSDIDAVFLQDPRTFLQTTIDVSFQRVAYFPRPLAQMWGFVACSGFVHFRTSPRTLAFLDTAVRMQRSVASDQIALNLSLLDWRIGWDDQWDGGALDSAHLMSHFVTRAQKSIDGFSPDHGLSVRALPPITFWRHSSVPFASPEVVIAHPNSPKDCNMKNVVFHNLGIAPWAPAFD